MNKLLLFSYGFFLFCFVFFSYLFIDPGLFYLEKLFTNFFQIHRGQTTGMYIFFLVFSFVFYFIFLQKAVRNTLSAGHVKILIGITLILLFSYPAMISFDIFNYIATAKVTFFYHENPYLLMPIEFIHDPLLLFMHAANKTALYAPFWIILTGIPYVLGFGNFLLTLFAFKIFVAACYLATVWLIWKMTKNISQTVFFALNPLVVIETLLSGHNDIVMMFLVLISFYFFFARKTGKSILFFLLSVFIKYASVMLLPLFLFAGLKHMSKQKFFTIATLLMYGIFFLSSFREEIYPWYGLWFLLPSTFLFGDNLITWVTLSFSFSLLLRYVPFMFLGTYFGPTPLLKITLTGIPVILTVLLYLYKKRTKIKFI